MQMKNKLWWNSGEIKMKKKFYLLKENVSPLQKNSAFTKGSVHYKMRMIHNCKKSTIKSTPIVTFVGLQSHASLSIRNNHYKCSHLLNGSVGKTSKLYLCQWK